MHSATLLCNISMALDRDGLFPATVINPCRGRRLPVETASCSSTYTMSHATVPYTRPTRHPRPPCLVHDRSDSIDTHRIRPLLRSMFLPPPQHVRQMFHPKYQRLLKLPVQLLIPVQDSYNRPFDQIQHKRRRVHPERPADPDDVDVRRPKTLLDHARTAGFALGVCE